MMYVQWKVSLLLTRLQKTSVASVPYMWDAPQEDYMYVLKLLFKPATL